MYVKITVKQVPHRDDVTFYADLPAGFIGPAIGQALDQAFDAGLLGAQRFAKVVKVLLHKDSSASGATVPLIGEDLIPDGYYVTVPTFDVLCDWPAAGDDEDEFDRAFDRMGVLFADDSVKPILACPLADRDAKGLPPGRSPVREPEPSAMEPVAVVDVPPKRLKVYFSSAVHEEYRGGDADFMKSMVDGLRAIGVEAVRLANTRLVMGGEQRGQQAEGKLVTLDYYKGLTAEQSKIGGNLEMQIEATIQCMLGYFAEELRKQPDILPILHIQSRLPGSGSAFVRPETIRLFRDAGVKVFVTVHEWLYNLEHLKARADFINPPTRAICDAADGAIFVNDLDDVGAKVAGSAFIPIPITVAFESIDVEAVLARPNRVMMFGLLRPSKGFDQAAKLGVGLRSQYLANFDEAHSPDQQQWAVWVVGKLTGAFTDFEGLVRSVFKDAIYSAVFPKAGWMKELDQILHDDDDAFNDHVIEKLRQCDALRAQYYQRYRADPPRSPEAIQRARAALGKKPALSKVNGLLMRVESTNAIVHAMADALGPTFAGLSELQRAGFDVNADEHVGKLEYAHRERAAEFRDMVREQLAADLWKAQIDVLQVELLEWEKMPLPVFFKLNLTEPALIESFKQCKYVYKPDDKGMADNASAMISPMANGCILFTSWGVVTPAEFTAEASASASGATPERYKLDFAGRYAKSIVLSKKKTPMTPENVIAAILKRESDGNLTNRETLENLKHLTEHRYLPIMVAARHVIYYRRKIFGDPRTILIPREEHQ